MPPFGKRRRLCNVASKQHIAREAFNDNKHQAKNDDGNDNDSEAVLRSGNTRFIHRNQASIMSLSFVFIIFFACYSAKFKNLVVVVCWKT
jgi:hypothetical protein